MLKASKTGPIGDQWHADDNERQQILQRARLCAALCDPAILPPENHDQQSKLPENYQSIGSQGLMNMEGKMTSALFPPGQPWFHLEISPEIYYDQSIPDEVKQQLNQALFLRELAMQSVLESANLAGSDDRGGKVGFRTAKRAEIASVLATGEALSQLTDDYRMKVYRRDQYVTNRDPCGDVRYHIIRELIDPLSLSPEHFAKTNLDMEEVKEKSVKERCVDLYTKVEWVYAEKHWKITQECNSETINSTTEQISPYFCTPFRLAPGEHYGRGFIELNLGDLRTLNEMEKRILELANLMSKGLLALDYASEVRETDLAKDSGAIIRCRVAAGVAQDVGVIKFDQVREGQFMSASIDAKTRRLGKAMLMESDSQPTGERVTAFQVARIAQELEGILGGAYTPIADMQQQPLVRRLTFQMARDKILPPLPGDAVRVNTLTGVSALVRASRSQSLMTFVQAAVALGPEAMSWIDAGTLMGVLARYHMVDEPGLVLSQQQYQAKQQAAVGQQAAMLAGQTAIETMGKVAEKQATAA